MKYIELKYKGNGAKRRGVIRMGGFHLEAHARYDNGREVIRKGQISGDFKLIIPKDGMCKVPDTQHNRKVLRFLSTEQKITVHGEEVINPPAFDVLSKVNLEEDAPDKAQETFSAEDVAGLKAKIAELESSRKEKKVVKTKAAKAKVEKETLEDMKPDTVAV
jgi:hypothetical protein